MKKITKIIILIAVIAIVMIGLFFAMSMNKVWVDKINNETEIQLQVTYHPVDVYENSPYVTVDPSKYDELKVLFDDVVCLRSFRNVFVYDGESYDLRVNLSDKPIRLTVSGDDYIHYSDLESGESKSYKILTSNFEEKLLEIIGDILPKPEKFV